MAICLKTLRPHLDPGVQNLYFPVASLNMLLTGLPRYSSTIAFLCFLVYRIVKTNAVDAKWQRLQSCVSARIRRRRVAICKGPEGNAHIAAACLCLHYVVTYSHTLKVLYIIMSHIDIDKNILELRNSMNSIVTSGLTGGGDCILRCPSSTQGRSQGRARVRSPSPQSFENHF